MKFILEIELAPVDDPLTYSDIAWSLRETANTIVQIALGNGGNKIDAGKGIVMDIRGNIAGNWSVVQTKKQYWRQSEDGLSSEFVEETS